MHSSVNVPAPLGPLISKNEHVLAGLIARWGVEMLKLFGPTQLPRLASVEVSGRVLLLALALAVTTSVVFGIVSALHISQGGAALKVGARSPGDVGRQRARRLLVASEVALSVVLLTGAGLLARSFVKLAEVDPSFDSQGVHTVKLSLVDSHYPYSEYRRIAGFYRQLLQRLDELGEVEAAGATSELPLDGSSYDLGPYAYDTPEGVVEWESVAANYRVVTPGFLRAVRARLVEGRFSNGRTISTILRSSSSMTSSREPSSKTALPSASVSASSFSSSLHDPSGQRSSVSSSI